MDKINEITTNKGTLNMNAICLMFGHKMNYDYEVNIGAPTTCTRCGHKDPGFTASSAPPMPHIKPAKDAKSSFVFNPEVSTQINLLECLRGMVLKYCDRDENDLPKPAEEQRCPCVAGAQRLIYSIEFHHNPPPF